MIEKTKKILSISDRARNFCFVCYVFTFLLVITLVIIYIYKMENFYAEFFDTSKVVSANQLHVALFVSFVTNQFFILGMVGHCSMLILLLRKIPTKSNRYGIMKEVLDEIKEFQEEAKKAGD